MTVEEALTKSLDAVTDAIQNKIMPGDTVRHNLTGRTYEVDKLYPGIVRCRLPRPKVTSFGVTIRHCLIYSKHVTKINQDEGAADEVKRISSDAISYKSGKDTTLSGGLS